MKKKARTVAEIERDIDKAKEELDAVYYRFCRCANQSPVPMCALRKKVSELEKELRETINN